MNADNNSIKVILEVDKELKSATLMKFGTSDTIEKAGLSVANRILRRTAASRCCYCFSNLHIQRIIGIYISSKYFSINVDNM